MTTPPISAPGISGPPSRRWWKEAVIYQVWPRSFCDSDGDGVGDLQGVIGKLDHIASLGVDTIWLSPHYDSPNIDNGYDVRDYRKVGAEYGTMADFDALVAGVKARGMRLVVDLVVNHTSDEHAWFVESRRSKDSPLRDHYIWREGRGEGQDGGPPNDWRSFFSGSAWTKDDVTGEWWLHLFHEKQPDLNWENPAVRRDVYDIMRFWLDRGVDGFRMDVIAFISKDQTFQDYPAEHRARPEYFHASGPRLHEYLADMRAQVLAPTDAVSIGEAFGVTFEQAALLTDDRRGELDMLIHFDAVRIGRGEGWRAHDWSLTDLKAVFSRQEAAMGAHTWQSIVLSNHDNPRLVSNLGDDAGPWRARSAMVLATMLMTLRGTPFIYQGDEFGMTNHRFADLGAFDDVEVKALWRQEVESGRVTAADFLSHMNRTSRDHARTPMAWDATRNGGFTAGVPWMALNPNFTDINAATDRVAQQSIQACYSRLSALRKATPSLIYGDFVDLAPDHPSIFIYTRRLGDAACLVALNFSRTVARYDPPPEFADGTLLFSTLPVDDSQDRHAPLQGWEARIYAARDA